MAGSLDLTAHSTEQDNGVNQALSSEPNVAVEDNEPLLTTEERDDRLLSRQLSEGQRNRRVLEEEATESRLRWPVRRYSTSSDPVARARRERRLEGFIARARRQESPHRTPPRPAHGSLRRVRTAPTRTSAAVSPRFLWFSGSNHSTGDLIRRASRHIRARSRPESASAYTMPVEESDGMQLSAPELSLGSSDTSSPVLRAYSPGVQQHGRSHCLPALQLWVHRKNTPRTDAAASHVSTSSSSDSRSVKSAAADTATTITDVHVLPVTPQSDKEFWFATSSSSDRDTPSPSIHVVGSNHGTYEFMWDQPPSSETDMIDEDVADDPFDDPEPEHERSDSPTLSLARVDTKLREWSFDSIPRSPRKKDSHPRFQPFVEVFQDMEDTQELPFNFDNENSISTAPPNSKRPTPGSSSPPSRTQSRQLSEGGNSSASSSTSESEPSEPEQAAFTIPRRLDQIRVLSGYHSPRPNKPLQASDHLKVQSRSFSGLDDLSDHTAYPLQNHRDSVILVHERKGDYADHWTHRDSIALARDRLAKKHALTGVAVPIKGGLTPPLDIPRVQQVAFVGGLSPIPDTSPTNGRLVPGEERRIAQLTRTP